MFVGVDLSLTGTGVVVIENDKILRQKLIKSKPVGDKPSAEIERMVKIIDEVMSVIDCPKVDNYPPHMVAIEGIAFMARNTTAMAQLCGLNYMLRVVLRIKELKFVVVAPSSLKKFITGHGNAQKDNIMLSVFQRYGETLTDNNIADAYGLSRVAEACTMNKKIPQFQEEVATLIKKQL